MVEIWGRVLGPRTPGTFETFMTRLETHGTLGRSKFIAAAILLQLFWQKQNFHTGVRFKFTQTCYHNLGAVYIRKSIPPRLNVSPEWDLGRMVYFTLQKQIVCMEIGSSHPGEISPIKTGEISLRGCLYEVRHFTWVKRLTCVKYFSSQLACMSICK